MANVLRKPMPGIASIECTRLKFEPGDRVLVRVHYKIDKDQARKIRRSIQKWAGVEVEVLIINTQEMDIDVSAGYTLSGPSFGG